MVFPADRLISQGNKNQISGGILGISRGVQLFLLSVFPSRLSLYTHNWWE